jgi:hypothetical protein
MSSAYAILSLILSIFFSLSLSAAPGCARAQDTGSTSLILQKADESRGNLKGVQWLVSIEDGKGGSNGKMAYELNPRGFDTLATATIPAKDKGNKIVMINGSMWFSKPGLSKPVPISRRQKLLGTAAYGDIAATNYAEDYSVQTLPDDTFQGISCYVYDLRAKSSEATYDRIKYWISKDDVIGIRAEYYTVSGKKFKSATMQYQNNVFIEGVRRPFISEIDIQDDILGGEHTTLTFENPKIGKIADHTFNLNLLRR